MAPTGSRNVKPKVRRRRGVPNRRLKQQQQHRNQRQGCVHFTASRKRFETHENTPLKGVTKVLQRHVYPDYSLTKAVYGPLPSSHSLNMQKRGWRSKRGGCLHGIRVEKRIQTTIELSQRLGLPNKVFYDRQSRLRIGKTIADQKDRDALYRLCRLSSAARASSRAVFRDTRNFWIQMDVLKLQPIKAQQAVGWALAGLGTAVDVVCKQKTDNKTVLIEIKTGYSISYLRHTRHRMKAPYAQYNDCPYHQHMLQLMLTTKLYKQTFKDDVVADAMILRFDSNGFHNPYRIQKWCYNGLSKLLSRIIASSALRRPRANRQR